MPPLRLAEVVRAFGVEPDRIRLIGRRANTHWRVTAGHDVFVLRRFREGPRADASAAWEHELLCDLAVQGWPVPRAVSPPRRVGDSLWLLMHHLAGRPLGRGPVSEAGYRWIGRRLAELHAGLDRLRPRPQRPGWTTFVRGALPLEGGQPWREALLGDLRAASPDAARIVEARLSEVEARDLPGVFAGEPLLAVHGDFSPWNVLVSSGRLCGVLDFEMAHMDVLAADLAFARRGYHDAVVDGYLELRSLTEAQLANLDALWLGSLFLSVWLVVEGWRRTGRVAPEQLDWNVEQLGKSRPYRPAS